MTSQSGIVAIANWLYSYTSPLDTVIMHAGLPHRAAHKPLQPNKTGPGAIRLVVGSLIKINPAVFGTLATICMERYYDSYIDILTKHIFLCMHSRNYCIYVAVASQSYTFEQIATCKSSYRVKLSCAIQLQTATCHELFEIYSCTK